RKWHDEISCRVWRFQRAIPRVTTVDHYGGTHVGSPARDLSTRTDETASKNWHRLAGSASGTGGSVGSTLDARDPESLKEWARRYREETERAIALAEAADEYENAVYRAG